MKNIMSQMNLGRLRYIILLLALTVPSWIINIDRVINVDEPRWVIRGANYYYALAHRDFANTLYEYHPGVTNMWIVATALYFYFPEYRALGQGYFDPLKPKFEEFMRKYDKEPIILVRNSRFIQAGVLAVLAVTGFLFLQLLVDQKVAFLSIALATIAPFFLGHSRLLNLEGMLSMFVLVSYLGMARHLGWLNYPSLLPL
jgi:dolichyl-phosphate-mannose--protein O-mannosyl transferase